ncbi:DUF7507 domain-containing protein [Paenibacillus glycanilyticus]|uniref:DUF7507 domain-containing protein n=1 Tax=Paenibacillus glycanilyticus TaxID=126569 RepID=UPI000FD718AE|nr:SdrD B-like domain-containing protein [Paenibacillus glycanilyticus]
MPATITGIVFNDVNHDGVFTAGEPGIPGAFVVLFSSTGSTCTSVQTDVAGNYSFSILAAGTYTVYETVGNPGATCPPVAFSQPAGFTMSNGPRKITLTVTAAQVTGNAVLSGNNFSHDTINNPLGCTTSMIQFSGRPSVWYNINIVTGTAVVQGTVSPPVDINGIGYNTIDNYIYGYDQLNNRIVRVDNNGNVITLSPLPPGLPADTYNVGTFDLNGFLYLFVNNETRFYVIDLRPNSSTFMKLVNPANGFLEQTSNFGVALSRALNSSDWVYRQQDGNLYAITPTGLMQRIVPNTGTITNITTTPLNTGPFGAVALDATGTIYAISNNDGTIYRYTISGNTAAASRFSSTVSSSFNDATMCALATINLDFGDAPDVASGNGPDNYSTLLSSDGPRHGLVNNLFLGTRVTAETDAHQNFDATGDDLTQGIQDDGLAIPLPPLIVNIGFYSFPVTVTNTTGTSANLYAWVDFNGDGIFQVDEASPVLTIPSIPGTQTYELHFFPPFGVTPILDHTFVRLRLTTDTLVNANPPGQLADTRSLGPATDGEVEDYIVFVQKAIEIFINKTAEPTEALPGQVITYTFSIKNPAPFPLTNVRIEDSLLGLVDIISFLPPESTVELHATYVVPPGTPAGSVIVNTVFAISDQTLPVQDQAEVIVLPDYQLSITKSPDRLTVPPGDTVTYRITVANLSNAPVTNVIVKDDLVGFTDVIPSLAAGESRSYNVPFLVPAGTLAGTVFNNLTVATSNEAPPVSDTATIVVPPILEIYLVKSVNPQVAAPGETVLYTINVTNAGNDRLTNIRITDPVLNVDQIYEAIDPGDSIIVTVPFVIPANALQGETIVNVASVTTDQIGPAQSDAVVKVLGQPAISLTKSVSPPQAARGDQVTYTLVIANKGNTVLSDVRLTDPLIGLDEVIGTLAIGEERTLNIPFIVPDLSVNPIVNTAAVSGTFETLTVTDIDEASLDILIPEPSIAINKSVDQTQAIAGSTVLFTFTVTNTGNTALTNVVINDPLLGYINTIAALEPGVSVIETVPLTIPPTAAAGTIINNTVIVTSTETPPQEESVIVTVVGVPELSITKTPSVENALPGATVTYTITVTNTGNVPLTNVIVQDALLGLSTVIPTLGIGASQSFTPSFVIPVGTPIGTVIQNRSTAASDQTDTIDTTANVLVDPLPPVMTVTKTPDREIVAPGGTVTYTITVANAGTVVLTGVELRDDTIGVASDIGTLNPGESRTLVFLYVVPSSILPGTVIVNTAVATSDQSNPEEGTSTVTVDPTALLQISKVFEPAEAPPGQTVTAIIRVQNTGNVELTNVIVTDAALGLNSVIPALPVGSVYTIPLPFIVPIVQAGTILTNTATATSTETGETSSTATLTVQPEFVLSLTKSVEPSVALAGDTVTFTFLIQNNSNTSLTNWRFMDELLGIDETADTIPPGFTIQLSRTFTIPAGTRGGTVLTNTAVLSSNETPPVTASANVTIPADPRLEVTKTVFPPIALPGETVFFRMRGQNTGNVPLTNIRVSDPLLGIFATVVSQDVGEALSLIIPFTVPDNAVPGTPIVNTILAESSQIGLVRADAVLRVIGPPLVVTKSADSPTIFVGDKVRFAITVANVSDLPINDAVLHDVLQAGTLFVPGSVDINGRNVSGADPAQGIPLGNLSPGQSLTVRFIAEQSLLPPDEQVENQASVSFRIDDLLKRLTIRSNLLVLRVEQEEE